MPAKPEKQSASERQAENLEAMIGAVKPETAAVLDRALSGADITS